MNHHFEIFLEEPSAEAFVAEVWGKMAPAGATYQTHAFQGKQELLAQLPMQLKAYAKWIPDHFRIVILVDEDRQDCTGIKTLLEKMCRDAGLGTLTAPGSGARVANRIAVEELEAWMLGGKRVEARPCAWLGGARGGPRRPEQRRCCHRSAADGRGAESVRWMLTLEPRKKFQPQMNTDGL